MSIGSDNEYWWRHKEIDTRVIEFLGRLDTGICDFQRREEPHEMPRELQEVLRELANAPIDLNLSGKQVTVELAHRSRDGEPVYLNLSLESAGTRRLLVMLSHAYRALDTGTPLVIDELDVSLHTLAGAAVLQLFCSPETNPKGAQLVATVHDTNLMGWPGLRRDQIWFTEKDEDGATLLYPLTDIRTRRSDNLEKGYLQGRYGAVPFDDPISVLGSN